MSRPTGVIVQMGRVLDGVAEHMARLPDDRTFLVADAPQPTRPTSSRELRETGADVLVNYLPVGSQEATEFYAECALEARRRLRQLHPGLHRQRPGVGASASRDAGVPIIGDDIKAQLGATIIHRVLTDLFAKRGVKLDRTYQLNTGGNTDFLNMSNRTPARVEEDLEDRGGAVGRRSSGSTTTTSTSARPTTSPGRTTTRSASCAWRASCSATCR